MSDFIANTLASASAGLVSKLLCHPLDTCKAKLQAEVSFKGFRDVIVKTLKNDGIRGFYQGIGPVIVGGIPGVCVYIGSYEYCKAYLDNEKSLDKYPFAVYFSSGMTAEIVCCSIFVPVDVIKERLQVQSKEFKDRRFYNGSYDAFTKICKEEGLRGLYKGYGATVFSYGPFSALYFLFYEESKKKLFKHRYGEEKKYEQLSLQDNLICSAVSGSLASFLTNPLDLAKLRFQIQRDIKNSEPNSVSLKTRYSGLIDALIKINKAEGLTGLFRGAMARVLFFTPATAITMALYEEFQPLMKNSVQ